MTIYISNHDKYIFDLCLKTSKIAIGGNDNLIALIWGRSWTIKLLCNSKSLFFSVRTCWVLNMQFWKLLILFIQVRFFVYQSLAQIDFLVALRSLQQLWIDSSLRIRFILASMGESARLAPSSSFYVVSSAILSCKSFKIRVNFVMISLKSYKSIGLVTFLN